MAAALALAGLLLAGCSEKVPTRVVTSSKVRGFGSAKAYPSLGIRTGETVIGDLDGDGRNDVVTIESGGQRILIYRQTGSGDLTGPTVIPTELTLTGVAVGDLNHDGRDELAVCGVSIWAQVGYRGRVVVFFGDPGSSGSRSRWYRVSANGVGDLAIGDLNGDGRGDLVTLDDGKLSVFYQTDADTLAAELVYDKVQARSIGEIHIGDVTGDSRQDVVLQSGLKRLAVVAQTADGTLSETPVEYSIATSYWPEFDAFALGDVNGDGLTDAVVVDPGNGGYMNILLQRGGALSDTALVLEQSDMFGIEIADLNGDGLQDIAGDTSGDVSVYYQTPDHTIVKPLWYFFYTQSFGGSFEHEALAVGDVTGDGLPDLAVTWSDEGLWVLPGVEH